MAQKHKILKNVKYIKSIGTIFFTGYSFANKCNHIRRRAMCIGWYTEREYI